MSLAAQAVAFVGFAWMIADLLSLAYVIPPEMVQGPQTFEPYILATVESYRSAFGVGILGAIAAYIIYLKSEFRASWYLRGTRIVGWLWLPFIPIGTLIGIVLLGARRSAIEAAAESKTED